jgi:murein DD-endopeptidase MepM/ murein hydrolase activator NlpD
MAFTVRPAMRGKHRRPRHVRTGVTLAGVAALTAGAAFGATAMAAPGQAAAPAGSTVFTQAADVPGALAHTLDSQAAAQHRAADTARTTADKAGETAAAKARAAAKAKAAARAKAGRSATARGSVTRAGRSSTRTAITTAGSGWMKPVGDAPVGTGYKASGSMWSSGSHTGVDFLVDSGTSVHSVAAGTVVSAGWDGSYGNDVIIRHADGKYTLYGHLTRPLVSAGQTVAEGQQIGVSGATGNATGPHLHFEVRTGPDYGSDIDPIAYMRSHGITI